MFAHTRYRLSLDDAFTQLVDTYYAPLFEFPLSLGRDAADACGLVQQTFLVWAAKGSALRDGSKVKTCLFTALYREFFRGSRQGTRVTAFGDLTPGEAGRPRRRRPIWR